MDKPYKTDDLVERLEDSKGWPNLGKAAAARIKELEAENARLRGGLEANRRSEQPLREYRDVFRRDASLCSRKHETPSPHRTRGEER